MRIIGECCFAFYISYHCQIQLDRHFTQLEEEQHNTRSHVRKAQAQTRKKDLCRPVTPVYSCPSSHVETT